MKNNISQFVLFSIVFVITNTAWAKPNIEVQTKSEKEIVQVVNGAQVKKRVAATTTPPGSVLYFILEYSNSGSEKATNVVFNNPVPAGTHYIKGTAIGAGGKISYSADNGKTFKTPSQLTYSSITAAGLVVQKQVAAKNYSHVKWLLAEIPAGGSGQLEFKVQVK